jgi:hypothetical protein
MLLLLINVEFTIFQKIETFNVEILSNSGIHDLFVYTFLKRIR